MFTLNLELMKTKGHKKLCTTNKYVQNILNIHSSFNLHSYQISPNWQKNIEIW